MPFLSMRRGVDGLSKLLEQSARRESLRSYCSNRLRAPGQSARQYLRIGVDVSSVLLECEDNFARMDDTARAACPIPGGQLGQFFILLACTFLKCPATFIFVFSNRNRNIIKRSRYPAVPEWDGIVREMISSFGYHVHEAPGESDAELAMLNTRGLIDAVLSNDTNIFVFGIQTVLQIPTSEESLLTDAVDVFTMDSLPLTHSALVMYAVTVGGDYTTDRICRAGTAMALSISQSTLASQLVDAFNNATTDDALTIALNNWRHTLRLVLRDNPGKCLPRRNPNLAFRIPETFPSPEILRIYIHPMVSAPNSIQSNKWLLMPPSLFRLTLFCHNEFNWSERVLIEKFRSFIWEGILLQTLYSPLLLYDPGVRLLRTPTIGVTIVDIQFTEHDGAVHATFAADGLVDGMSKTFKLPATDRFSVTMPKHLFPSFILM